MKVVLYARVSTSDKDQNPETQLVPLRDFCLAQGWEVHREYVDYAPANDLGRLLLNLLASLAEFELELIRERVKAGMERARRQGRKIGRPRVIDRRGFQSRFGAILERLIKGDISRRQAAKELKIGYATLKRLLDSYARDLEEKAS